MKLKIYKDSIPKAYIHIYNQCSTNLKNDLEASAAFPQVESTKDPIGLLKLIQGLCCSYDSKTQSDMATVASQKKLFTFFQRDGMDNSLYHWEFVAHVETIETYGGTGAIGITPAFVAQKLQEMHAAGDCQDIARPSPDELAIAHKCARKEFFAALMLSGANRVRYGALRTELSNQYTFGNDLYPKTVDQCLTMMNRRMDSAPRQLCGPPHHPPIEQPIKTNDKALVFAQGTNKPSTKNKKNDSFSKGSSSSSGSVSHGSKITTVVCRNCGRQDHVSAVCPYKKPPEQIYTIAAEPDDASESSGEGNVLILAQVDHVFVPSATMATPGYQRPPTKEGFFFTQDAATPTCCPISSNLLLLDSQSMVHLFSQPEHVDTIRPATTPTRIHCNKGTLKTTQEANFCRTPVYFDARGIANVLSLYQFGQKFKVTYDSTNRGGVFKVFTSDGVVKFTPTSKGLHAINRRDNPEAAFLFLSMMLISPLVILW